MYTYALSRSGRTGGTTRAAGLNGAAAVHTGSEPVLSRLPYSGGAVFFRLQFSGFLPIAGDVSAFPSRSHSTDT